MKFKVSHSLDNLENLIREMKDSSTDTGAVAIFVGVVRSSHENERVLNLEYEAHKELALKRMTLIIEESKVKYGITDATIEHRIGTAKVGEDIMYVLVTSKHRQMAFQALTEIVDRIKHEVPIWKKEVTEKGDHWVENT